MPTLESRDQDQHTNVPNAHPSLADETRVSTGSSFGSIARKVGVVVIIAGAAGFAYWKIQGNQKETADAASKTMQAANRAIPVTTATIAARTMPIYLTELGTVTAYNTVTIKSRVDGELLTVNVREGQQVQQPGLLTGRQLRRVQRGQVAQPAAGRFGGRGGAGEFRIGGHLGAHLP